MRIEAQPASGGDARILLPQRTGCGVARIGERRSACILLLAIECMKIIPTHEHFAADFHEVRNILFRPTKLRRDGADSAHVQCDVFTGDAIATSQPLLQHAASIDEIQCQTIDFDLAAHWQRLAVRPIEIANHRIVPVLEFLDRKDIIKAHHAAWMPHGSEIVGERAANSMGGRLWIVQRGERRLKLLQATQARIIGGIGADGRIIDVVGNLVGLHPSGHTSPQTRRDLGIERIDVKTIEPHRVIIGGVKRGHPLLGTGGKAGNAFVGPDLGRIPIVEIPCQLFVRAHDCLS